MIQRPMADLLRAVSRRTSLHMPGAQGKAPFEPVDPYLLDTTELPVTDDLYAPSGAIGQAQRLAAKSAGAACTMLLQGGSTAGVHAMLLYAARTGDTVILPRNVHISALHICAVAGLSPVFAKPSYTVHGRPYTPLSGYLEAMDAHPEAKAVLAVRPDYYGVACDLTGLAQAAHHRGMLVLCDEAHGAYFNWDPACRNALACGADLAVQSAHKTLPALNPGAWLHGGPGVDEERLRRLTRMVQTSSPSFVTMLALDDARAWMDEQGAAACEKLRRAIARFKAEAEKLGMLDGQKDFPAELWKDGLRLALDAPQGGFALGRQLARRGLDVEMCDDGGVVCILSLMDGEERLESLLNALRDVNQGETGEESPLSNGPLHGQASFPAAIPPRILPIREAAFADCEPVPLAQAVGRVSAGQTGLYPPGVALVTAGEQITEEIAAFLRTLDPGRVFGMNSDGTLNCVRI